MILDPIGPYGMDRWDRGFVTKEALCRADPGPWEPWRATARATRPPIDAAGGHGGDERVPQHLSAAHHFPLRVGERPPGMIVRLNTVNGPTSSLSRRRTPDRASLLENGPLPEPADGRDERR
jgi:hypothetical protein